MGGTLCAHGSLNQWGPHTIKKHTDWTRVCKTPLTTPLLRPSSWLGYISCLTVRWLSMSLWHFFRFPFILNEAQLILKSFLPGKMQASAASWGRTRLPGWWKKYHTTLININRRALCSAPSQWPLFKFPPSCFIFCSYFSFVFSRSEQTLRRFAVLRCRRWKRFQPRDFTLIIFSGVPMPIPNTWRLTLQWVKEFKILILWFVVVYTLPA